MKKVMMLVALAASPAASGAGPEEAAETEAKPAPPRAVKKTAVKRGRGGTKALTEDLTKSGRGGTQSLSEDLSKRARGQSAIKGNQQKQKMSEQHE